jgi:hypothetical protein
MGTLSGASKGAQMGAQTGNPYAAAAGAIIGGIFGHRAGKKKKKAAEKAYQASLQAARPDQTNEWGDTLKWTKDDKGNWQQTVTLSPERKAQQEAYQRTAAGSMAMAEKWGQENNPSKQADWNKMGLGAFAENAGLIPKGTSTTGKRPWADSPYSSMGGDSLRYLQYAGPGSEIPMTQTWGSGPMAAEGGSPPNAPPPVQTAPPPPPPPQMRQPPPPGMPPDPSMVNTKQMRWRPPVPPPVDPTAGGGMIMPDGGG